ncbi:glutamate dehydrogenase [Desulfuromusa kysingii]|uniref:Glutamate dehydrogenase n=1 Tax=Desulfuromusa kysingii TaxID=37625 RepID=A0A1H3YXN0_9BACT|nr:NAD-glutamate dehydrogenase domain-containing protein [Desulfuromusa kysingii]SEA15814.1 glutamate dehydrogenase [Desulfuromusa kysingii]
MKVTVTRGGRTSEEREILLRSETIEKELIRQGQEAGLSVDLALANILRQEIPENYLSSLSLSDLVANLLQASKFLSSHRTDEIVVKLQAQETPGHYYLFTNSPDANHIFFSLQEYLHRRSLHFRVFCHPILSVVREDGLLKRVSEGENNLPQESFIWMELERLPVHKVADLEQAIRTIISSAVNIHQHRPAMLQKLTDLGKIAGLSQYQDLYQWLQQENFIPVASRSYTYAKGADASHFYEEKSEALGLEQFYDRAFYKDHQSVTLTPENVFPLLGHGKNVDLETTELRCPLHRFERLTYLGFREELGDDQYREHCFWGFYTQKSIDENTFAIPALKQRIELAQQQLNIPPACHNYLKTIQIINSFPKIELFLMGDVELRRMLRSFTQMHRQAGVKVVVAPSASEVALTLMLIMPNDYYLPEHIERMELYLRRYFRALSVESRLIHLASDYLSLHVNLQLQDKDIKIDLVQLEQGLTKVTMPWKLKFRALLEKNFAEDSFSTWERYSKAFNKDYRARTHPRFAVRDVYNIEKLLHDKRDAFDLWGPFHEDDDYYRLQYYSFSRSYLNDLMPFLQNLDLRVLHEVDSDLLVDTSKIYIKSFAIKPNAENSLPFKQIKSLLLETLRAMRNQEVENDYLHRLQPLTGLSWREIDVFRGYRNYYFQLGSPFTKKRVADALVNNAKVALLLYRYFEGRFKPSPKLADPMTRELEVLSPIRQQLVTALEVVSDPNEDKILRTLFNLIDSTIRTNFFLRYQQDDYFFSFKVNALGVIDMPSPRPLYEVYVHSATMEGLHLRGGKVARGGIRWSDRPDDFRTEVLGLVKAQMTKNAVIVPEGSKGGFFTKRYSADRDEMGQIVKEAYQTLMRGLLDLTDNRTEKDIIQPEGLITYDDLDPYLVVAADKGTAHLPDTANAVSESYDFWLGDAFASGGSHGYDHKQLGITARGAWESVKRSFREMGHDIQTQPFTVVGIGDMSGDVFGNGMLCSRQTKLLAAFDHRHIFLDPNPDTEISYQERQRLYDLPRSCWDDYNKELISAGGGVYSRQLKEIPLSPEVAEWLGVRQGSIDVPGLIKLLLRAKVDLLWNGGIGTYVKSSLQSNEDVGDRANDPVRIDGIEIRAKVVGEGGNLGLTQLGRIEYALNGGRVNTDAIDNSAGVDTSDHEVNLKILLRQLRFEGHLKNLEDGYELLGEMEETVCQDVLANNYTQTLSLSLDEMRCRDDVEPYLELIDRLVSSGLLDRRGEFLPSRKEVSNRQPNRLLRPEFSVLLAYSKMYLFKALLDSEMPENSVVSKLLFDYFPQQVIDRYSDSLKRHPLAKEISATILTNRVIDQAGSAFLQTTSRMTGCPQVEVANAYLIFDNLLTGHELRQAVFALDNKMSAEKQYQLLLKLEDLLSFFCSYALSNGMTIPSSEQDLERIAGQLQEYAMLLSKVLPAESWQQCKQFQKELQECGLAKEVAYKFAVLDSLTDFLPLICMLETSGQNLEQLAKIKVLVDAKVNSSVIYQLLDKVPVVDSWDRRARESLVSSLHAVNVRIIQQVALDAAGQPENFFSKRRQKMRIFEGLRQSLINEVPRNFHPFTVLLRSLESLLTA